MGSWETPGFLSWVAMWTLCYSGRDQADEETPVVSESISAMRYHAPSQPICVILFITDAPYLSPNQKLT